MMFLNQPYHMSFVNLALAVLVTVCFFLYRRFFPKQKINFLILLLIIGLLPTFSIFREGTYRSGDMNTHTIQLMDFYPNFQEGTFLPRWTANLCGGYGCPIFMIEYLLPYYVASLFHFIGFSFLFSTKLTLVVAFVLSGITMYLWSKEEFGKLAGFVSAIFYLYAPYHLIDFHFRGSSGEVLSFVFIPLLFLFAKRLIEKEKTKNFFFLAITILLIIISHANTTLISLPLMVGYGLVVWMRKKNRKIKDLLFLAGSILYGALLAAFYWLPAMDAVKHTWLIHTTYGDFKPITEYIYSPILYGVLFQGHQGEFRLIVGYFHLAAIVLSVFLLVKNKINKKFTYLLLYFLGAFLLLFFMMLHISEPIWKHISLLHTFIVVWRLLVPIAFISSAIAGIVMTKITNTKIIVLMTLVIIFSTIPNWANRAMVPLPDKPFLNEPEYYTEYFEKGNSVFETSYNKRVYKIAGIISHPPKQPITFINGKGSFVVLKRTHVAHEYAVQVKDSATILENTNYFPGWKVFVNGKEVSINYKNKKDLGRITFELEKGIYKVEVRFTKTRVVFLAEIISLSVALLGILSLLYFYYFYKKNYMVKKKIFLIIIGFWILLSFFSLFYNFTKSIWEIKEWAPLSDSKKRSKIFGNSHDFFVFIENHTEKTSHIFIYSKDIKTFYLSKYYLYPRLIDSTDKYYELQNIGKIDYQYIASDENIASLKYYSIVASNSGKFYLYKKNE